MIEGTFTLSLNKFSSYTYHTNNLNVLKLKSPSCFTRTVRFRNNCELLRSSLQGSHERSSLAYKANSCHEGESEALPHVQTLRMFPWEKLMGKVVMVRFDASFFLRGEEELSSQSASNSISTIKYLKAAGAKVVLVSGWSERSHSGPLDVNTVAEILSSVLQLKVNAVRCLSRKEPMKMDDLEEEDIFILDNLSEFKEEAANCSKFAKLLSTGVDIFVNDSFSVSHRILASNVGIASYCSDCLAGFRFEESLSLLKKTVNSDKKPYVAIIGGGNFYDNVTALRFLATKCDGLVFVGMMSFQIMHVLGHAVPPELVESRSKKPALHIIQLARQRKIPILCPGDFWCMNKIHPEQMQILSGHGLSQDWLPVDLGPMSLNEIESFLKGCRKVIWIGSVRFKFLNQTRNGLSRLVQVLDDLSRKDCHVSVVGNTACKAVLKESYSPSVYDLMESASVVWEFFKGRKLPGVMTLDRAYPFDVDWDAVFSDPSRPLVVDIGSGNGLFLFEMGRKRKSLNFLGLEINEKLVQRCLGSIQESDIDNVFFIATNATSTFCSIVSTYPGELVLVSIQCPNPDFNKPEHRWRMMQSSLVEAIADLLSPNGKVFLQSDVEAVAIRMKQLFLKDGSGKLTLSNDQSNATKNQDVWLEENPFEARSDWEQHVLDRGALMYRVMFSKSPSSYSSIE